LTVRSSTYTTKQGQAILAYLRTQGGKHLTAAQIEAHLSEGGTAIGRTTVYRQLDKLVRQGLVRKYLLDGSAGACFQYAGEDAQAKEHFHLKCEGCGKLIHLDSGAMSDVEKGILAAYAFEVDVGKTIFYGRCRTCSQKERR